MIIKNPDQFMSMRHMFFSTPEINGMINKKNTLVYLPKKIDFTFIKNKNKNPISS
jgi:hypothetical protein